MTNEMVLEGLYAKYKRTTSKFVVVSGQELKDSGWSGSLPTTTFKKFDGYWVRLEKSLNRYKVVKIESWMLETMSEKSANTNAPLPVSGGRKFNLKDMYMKQIIDKSKPKDGK